MLGMLAATMAAHRPSLLPFAAGALLLWQGQETLRRALLAKLRHRDALPGDALSYLGQAAIIWVMTHHATGLSMTPEAAFALVGLTSLAAAALQAFQLGVTPGGWASVRGSIGDSWRIGRWVLFSTLVGAVSIYASPWTLQGTAGASEVARFSALATMLNLTNPVMITISGLIVPAVAAARCDGPAAVRGIALRYALLGAILLLPYFTVLMLMPRLAMVAFYGADSPYLGLTGYLRVFVAGYAMMYGVMICTGVLNGLEQAHGTFVAAVVASAANAVSTVPLAIRFGLIGATLGGVPPVILQLLVAAWMVRRAARAPRYPGISASMPLGPPLLARQFGTSSTTDELAIAKRGGKQRVAVPGHSTSELRTPMSNTPVSILLPAYNAARFLSDALDSVLAQTHADFELIAINDGSTDETLEILRAFERKDSRVRVISHPNIGMGKSLNEALEVARHDWIVRMDADDIMVPRRIERQLGFLAEHPDLVVAGALVCYIDADGKVIGRYQSPFTDPAKVRAAREEGRLIFFHHSSVIMRRDVIRAVGGYRPQFWPADDVDLWNRVAEQDPVGPHMLMQDEYLVHYRIHGSSVCVASSRLATQKGEWVEACVKLRRAGRPELSWEQFTSVGRSRAWPVRLNQARRDCARAWYKSAVFHYSRHRYARFAPAILGATLLEPGFVLPRVFPQVAGKGPAESLTGDE
jgi:glycosyltransferase involved in cell wall biosynthesis